MSTVLAAKRPAPLSPTFRRLPALGQLSAPKPPKKPKTTMEKVVEKVKRALEYWP